MGDKSGNVDEFIEQVEGEAMLRGTSAAEDSAVGIDANEPFLDRDGENQDDAVHGDETLEFAAGRTETRRLDLHELVLARHVRDEAVHGGLDLRVGDGPGVTGLECRVERALAEGREASHCTVANDHAAPSLASFTRSA